MTILSEFRGPGGHLRRWPGGMCGGAGRHLEALAPYLRHALLPAYGRGRRMTGSAAKRWTLYYEPEA